MQVIKLICFRKVAHLFCALRYSRFMSVLILAAPIWRHAKIQYWYRWTSRMSLQLFPFLSDLLECHTALKRRRTRVVFCGQIQQSCSRLSTALITGNPTGVQLETSNLRRKERWVNVWISALKLLWEPFSLWQWQGCMSFLYLITSNHSVPECMKQESLKESEIPLEKRHETI